MEADRVSIIGAIPSDGNHGEDISEAGAVLAEVWYFQLNLVVGVDRSAHVLNQVLGHMLARRSLINGAVVGRRLEKAAVAANHLLARVACQLEERIRCIHDGRVRKRKIAKDHGTRRVNRTKVYLGIRPCRDSELRG